MRRRRIIGAAVGLLALAAIVAPVGLVWYRLHPLRIGLDDDPGRHGLAYEPIEFTSPLDGVTLRGWYLPAPQPTRRTIVVAPGIDDNRLVNGVTLRLAPALLDAGFDVLAFDFRGEGESDDGAVTFGVDERWDVLGAVGEARARGADRVGVIGFSLGASAALRAAAASTDIDAVVAESSYADLRTALRHELETRDHIPGLVSDHALWLLETLGAFDIDEAPPVEVVGRIAPRPILLIHGTADETVPLTDSDRLLAAASSASTERWVVRGGRHALAYDVDPGGYARRVVLFLERALR